MSIAGTQERYSIGDLAEITYTNNSLSVLSKTGANNLLVDKSVNGYFQAVQDYVMISSVGNASPIATTGESCTFDFEFPEEKTLNIEVPFHTDCSGSSYASTTQINIYSHDGNNWVQEEAKTFLIDNFFTGSGHRENYTISLEKSNIQSKKYRLEIIVDLSADENTTFKLIFPEVIFIPSVTHLDLSIAGDATVTYFEQIEFAGGVFASGTGPIQGIAFSAGFNNPIPYSDLEIRRWTYDFGQDVIVNAELPFNVSFSGLDEDPEYILTEIIIESFNGESFVEEEKKFYALGIGTNQRDVPTWSCSGMIVCRGIKTQKVRLSVNFQAYSTLGVAFTSALQVNIAGFSIFPELFGINVWDVEVVASSSSQSPVRIAKGGNTYGFPLVETNDVNASALRIFDGVNIKAFKKS